MTPRLIFTKREGRSGCFAVGVGRIGGSWCRDLCEMGAMMQVPDDVAFRLFTEQCRTDLQRIARHTRGEYQLGDVVSEAWLLASNLRTNDGASLDLSDEICQARLLSHLYQHLVRYAEKNVRYAIRLDHSPIAGGHEGGSHPVARSLVSNDGRDPLREFLELETRTEMEARLAMHGSLAAAYVYLLRDFDNQMSRVADHLRISRSYAYRCCAKARRLAARMRHIPVRIPDDFILGPWRSFRLRRPHVQLAFCFDDQRPM